VIIEISDPAVGSDLVAFLRAVRCEAEQAGPRRISVSLPDAPSEQAAQRKLELYLAEWQARHPGKRARRKPRYDL
jgi:hypothetical protein